MKNQFFIIITACLFFGCNGLNAKLNQFGISDLIPSHADDNKIFDQRISEELLNGKSIKFRARRTTNFTIQDILQFIPRIDAYFQYYLNSTSNRNPNDFELIKLAIIDVEKAKKMLRRQDVTAEDEHVLRDLFNPIKTKINGYKHTDNIEGSSYIQEQSK